MRGWCVVVAQTLVTTTLRLDFAKAITTLKILRRTRTNNISFPSELFVSFSGIIGIVS